ncbi:MAG: ribosome-binding factor A [Parcubacteria group bacterium]|jgi:ribosome-binding factor A
MSDRIIKINSLIQQHMGEILTRDISLKAGVFVTIAKVDTTPDLRYTRIFISIFPEKEIDYTVKTLEKELYQIQGKLNKRLVMRPLPKIEFKVDMTESGADKIEKLLKQI